MVGAIAVINVNDEERATLELIKGHLKELERQSGSHSVAINDIKFLLELVDGPTNQ